MKTTHRGMDMEYIGSLSITELAYVSLTSEHERTMAAYHTAMTTVSYGPLTAGTPYPAVFVS